MTWNTGIRKATKKKQKNRRHHRGRKAYAHSLPWGAYLAQGLRQRGHSVLTVGLGQGLDVPVTHPFTVAHLWEQAQGRGFRPEGLLYCDNGNMPLLLDPQYAPVPSLWYSIDTYCNPWHIPYGYGFDAVLVAQKDYVSLFADEGMDAQWFPLFCSSALAHAAPGFDGRDIPVAFVGTVGHKNNPDRKPFLEAFRRQHPLVLRSGDFVPIFRRSRIVLNQTAASEVNFRCMEALACGAALLTEHCRNGLDELFTIGEEILPTYTHGDAAGAVRITVEALARPQRLAEIAAAGLEAVRQRHTDVVRAAALEAIFTRLWAGQVQTIRATSGLERRDTLVRTAFGVLASDLHDPALAAYRKFYDRVFLESPAGPAKTTQA